MGTLLLKLLFHAACFLVRTNVYLALRDVCIFFWHRLYQLLVGLYLSIFASTSHTAIAGISLPSPFFASWKRLLRGAIKLMTKAAPPNAIVAIQTTLRASRYAPITSNASSGLKAFLMSVAPVVRTFSGLMCGATDARCLMSVLLNMHWTMGRPRAPLSVCRTISN
jgi:hypothetical protein